LLRADREAVERDARALSSAIDAIVVTPAATRSAAIDRLRIASIAANDRLFDASDAILARSFRLRIAGYELAIGETIGFGVLGAVVGCAGLTLVWRGLRARDERELAHANERAATLEAQLARRNAEAALELTEHQFRAVFDQSPVGIGIIERGGTSIDANATLRALFDDDLAQIELIARQMFAEIESGQATARRAEHRFDFAGRPSLWADVSLSLIFGGRSSRAPRAMVMVHNVTEYKTLHAQLDHQTLHDALTGLPNRKFFTRRLAALAAARDEPFEVVFIDLDRFKSVNDTLGHHAGDDVLVAVATRLLAIVRANDVVARLHGDEFALLLLGLTDRDSTELEEIANRVVLGLRLFVGDAANPIAVSASMGIVRSQTQSGGPDEYLRAADAAMYQSKMRGGDCFTIFDPTMTAIGP
jgi:diguanylate cyclase (GGDEF)-like protein